MQELKELIEFLQEKKVGEFRLERGEWKVELKFESALTAASHAQPQLDPAILARLMAAAPQPAFAGEPAVARQAEVTAAPAAKEEQLHTVKSPIVGTFYDAPSPGSPAFVKVGDQVEAGQPLCIVEAMKLMNEIESDAAGEIVTRMVQNGQPVEYGQPLFAMRLR